MAKVFVSYSHKQGKWVRDRLVPCLEAAGAELLMDRDFEVGKTVEGQMDAFQDRAEKHVLVLSQDYLDSRFCRHEMNRAVALDPGFSEGVVIPILRVACPLPDELRGPNPLYANLIEDNEAEPWQKVFDGCCPDDLGSTAPDWLAARDRIVDWLKDNQSVNLVYKEGVAWKAMVDHIQKDFLRDLALVDLADPDTTSRRGLPATICKGLGASAILPDSPGDLSGFKTIIMAREGVSRTALIHFDLAPYRPYYDVDLFVTFQYLIKEKRKLVLLAVSKTPFAALLPKEHPLSEIDLKTVRLETRP